MLVFFAVLGIALLADARVVEQVPRIFNGKNAWIETFPYQVSIEYKGSHLCGGSIVSKHYVLTAAHCSNIVPDKLHQLSVRAGTSYPSRGGSLHQVVEFIIHEDFDLEKYNLPVHDIAIIKVKEPFVFDDSCQPIELFEANEEVTPGAMSIVTGFGLVDDKNPADQLQVVALQIVSKQHCEKIHRVLPEGQICSQGENGKDSCTGDSGGPLAVDGRQAGIVSWGKQCGDSRFPSVYTEIAYYRDWINKHVEF